MRIRRNDLLLMIESELRERRFASIVRLEVENMDPIHRGMLAAELSWTRSTKCLRSTG